MLLSSLFTKTAKDSQSDASSPNADLLTRAGFIHKTMAGVYSFLPLGSRVLRKIEDIVREEMDTIGSEVFLSALAPQENWEKTGRCDSVDVLFAAMPANDASKRTNDAKYILNSTHEELITPIVQSYVHSYQDLPCAAYQIQTKFRNEARPKSGILRGREFRMKDLYSFHADEQDMLDYFNSQAEPTYTRVFERLGLDEKTVIALASGGSFSKEPSREFQTLCENGEDLLFKAAKSGVYYNREIAPAKAMAWGNPNEEEKDRKDIVGKGIVGVEGLSEFLNIEVERTSKTLLYETDDERVVAAVVRGGYDVNEEKLCTVVDCHSVQLASAETVKKLTGAEVGYAGPIGLPPEVEVVWDDSCRGRKNFECGANKTNEHSVNVNFGRDVPEPDQFYDIKVARDGDLDPETDEPYQTFRASEVGNIFTLYTKFSDAFGFTYTDAEGQEKPVYMGCYGIGTSRVMGVIAEVSHDADGLIWPKAVAPAQVHIVPIAKSETEEAYEKAMTLYTYLQEQGIECLFDDRLSASVGSRLADADLIGVPTRIVISAKTLAKETIEMKDRATGAVEMLSFDEAGKRLGI